jgi:hypothetical protein
MRGTILVTGMALACSGCVTAEPDGPVISQITTTASPNDPACRDYTAQAVIEGQTRPIVGRACLQQDGTWKIVEGPPGQVDQYTTVYAPPPYAYYGYLDPWLWSPPIGLSLGAFIFVDRNHRFHDGHRFAHFDHMHHFAGHHFAGHHGFGHRGGGGRFG